MQGLLLLMLKTLGTKTLFKAVWQLAKPKVEEFVAHTSNQYDNDTLKVVEGFVEDFLGHDETKK